MAFTLLEIFSMRFWSWRGSTQGRMSLLLSAAWGRMKAGPANTPTPWTRAQQRCPQNSSHSSGKLQIISGPALAKQGWNCHRSSAVVGLGHRKRPEPFLQVAKGWQKSHKDSLAAAAAKFWAEPPYACMRTESHCSLGANHCYPDHGPLTPLLSSRTS